MPVNTKIADGLRAAESAPEVPALNLQLAIVTDSDLTGAATALTQSTDKFAKQLDTLNADLKKKRAEVESAASQMFEHKDHATRHTETAMTKYQREQLAAKADGFRSRADVLRPRTEFGLIQTCGTSSSSLTLTI